MKGKPTCKFMPLAPLLGALLLCAVLLKPDLAFAQGTPRIASEVDTTSIRIGEQVLWTVSVDVDSSATVIFPEGQTFSPLETVEALKTDTTRKSGRRLPICA